MTGSSQDECAEAVRVAGAARARHQRLTAQLKTTANLVGRRRQELTDLESQLQAERAEVDRLAHLSPAKVWATLRGNVSDRLTVERAEVTAAELAVAAARARLTSADADNERVRREHDLLRGAEGAYVEALAAYERALHAAGSHQTAELTEIAVGVGQAESHLRELAEARDALAATIAALDQALAKLDSAGGWSTYDTFFGGGIVADAIKHSRIGEATDAFVEVNRHLERLSVELADIGASALDGVTISDTLAVFDVLFDNILSDWMVRDRIAQARTSAAKLHTRLEALAVELEDDARRTAARVAAFMQRREEIVTAA
ncbi:hypothetical protein [Demequina sp. NBRC 110055]|uniref:hypothetical protein n=1 Tax=Demequina sp. NBRC 110055 TaxID=1570344 RepID=UPI0009FD6BAC|nr:hypothetical protein [Demequina sp. NBRC 110055]